MSDDSKPTSPANTDEPLPPTADDVAVSSAPTDVETSVAHEASPGAAKSAPGLIRSAGLIALVTILSKILGAARDWQISTVYGLGLSSEAYFAAQQLPSFSIILLGGLGGPFHTATVAVFSKLIRNGQDPDAKARKLASSFVTLTGVVFAALSLLCYFFATPIMGAILGNARPELIHEAAIHLKIMSPVIFIGGIVGIFYGLLNVYHCYVSPSLSPAALSVVMILALLIFPHDAGGEILAWSTLAGATVQLLLQVPDMVKRKFSLMPAFDWKSPEIRQIGELLFPAMVGTTIGQLTVYVDMFFTSGLPVGSWSAITLGNRLIQLPIGVLQTAFLVPIFPRFTRYVADKEFDQLKKSFCSGVVALWLISIPILILALFFTDEAVRLIFQHGQFDADDTRVVSQAFLFLAFSMLPYFARDSITRIFYAFHDAKTPLIVGMIAIFSKAILDWLLVGPFGVGGITGSTTIVTLINMILLGLLSRRHIKDLGFKTLVSPFCKLIISGIFMVCIILLVLEAMKALPADIRDLMPRHPALYTWTTIAVSGMAGMFVYCVTAFAFKIPEAEYLVDKAFALLGRIRFRR